MTYYTADGDLGAMLSEEGPVVGPHAPSIFSAQILEGENDIPLWGLSFNEISWKVRVHDAFEDRMFLDAFLGQIQYDSDISGFLDLYVPGDRWFVRTEGINEGLEIHGGVDEAWWQIIYTGLGRALFTNGQQSVEVDLVSGDFYTVTMSFSSDTGFATLTLYDRGEDVVASLSASGLSIPLSTSWLGSTGTAFNYQGPALDASDAVSYVGSRVYSITFPYGESEQFMDPEENADQWVYGDQGIPLHTNNLGTTAGYVYFPWTAKPWWAYECTGALDYTFAYWAYAATWYQFLIGEVPEGYEYLRVVSHVMGRSGSAIGSVASMSSDTTWPNYFGGGYTGGSGVVFPDLGETMMTLVGEYPITGGVHGLTGYVPTISSNSYHYFSQEPSDWAAVDVYACGTGWDWPYLTGEYNSWTAYAYGPDSGFDWEFEWVASIDRAEQLVFEVDDIWFGGPLGETVDGEVISEEYEVAEGWNTEMVRVEGGIASIRATPVMGTVNVFSMEGELLDYGDEWEEADDLGLDYRIHTDDEIVTFHYFVSRPTFEGDIQLISRPSLIAWSQSLARGTLVHGS